MGGFRSPRPMCVVPPLYMIDDLVDNGFNILLIIGINYGQSYGGISSCCSET